ncbi:membrane protein [Flexivirga endophytica]|uniref:Membrane protein n=1 Tax=Flexivirga endophytica TaxID=1849103 RepID=A0A916T6G7_9MICO|nr:membrane protein [Flexivirga endophytica]GHB41525.1 membrane protein [Flexivirga endophytica]
MKNASSTGRVDALDGIRGVLVIFLLSYHFGLSRLSGAWLTLNVFFVLSGFLIVRLLVQERARSGRIDFLAFYARRARRLLPALAVLLAAVLVYGLAFASESQRATMRWDVLGTMFYFMNWRLISQSDQYFVHFTEPSVLQHAWSLSVEEQFYLVAPLLVLALMALLRTRRALIAVLVGLAVVSAGWMAYVGVGSDLARSHLYYGTDTRAQSLLLGAALGVASAHLGRNAQSYSVPVKQVQIIGWAAFALTVLSFVVAAPQTTLMADGGMFVLSLITVVWVWATADERGGSMQRVLGWRPLAGLGRISYGAYLYHWPIGLWVEQALPDAPVWQRVLLAFPLSIGVATLSYQRIERPIHDRGWRVVVGGPIKARTVAVGIAVALAVGALGVHGNPAAAAESPNVSAPTPDLVRGQAAYEASDGKRTIALFGDSVPDRLAKDFPSSDYRNLEVVDAASSGCDLLDVPYLNPGNGDREPLRKDCVAFKKKWPQQLEGTGTELLLVIPSRLLQFPHQLDGKARTWGDPVYDRAVEKQLDVVAAGAERAGAGVAMVTMPCYDEKSAAGVFLKTMREHSPQSLRSFAHPAQLNAIVRKWARAHGAPVIDLKDAVCGSGDSPKRPGGYSLYADGVHFSPWGAKVVWKWLVPQAVRLLGEKS